MRLEWFLPTLRKSAKRPERETPRLVADAVRRFLALLGPSWLASPLRRLVQVVSLLVFLLLFFYVCWPYDTRPANISNGWSPLNVDAEAMRVVVTRDEEARPPITEGSYVYAVDPADETADVPHLGRFLVEKAGERELTLTSADELSPEQVDQMLLSMGPWSLHEAEPGSWPSHYADDFRARERISAELFLSIDPLVSISTALAGKCWVWSLTCAAVILLICVVIPRGFCGYVCPLGTLIDLFDWVIGRRIQVMRTSSRGPWVHAKYYILLGTLVASALGILVSGFVAAIPVLTRAVMFLVAPLQLGLVRDWHQVPPMNVGHYVSLALAAVVFVLGVLRPRFWCNYLCPTGAVFSVANLAAITRRKVDSTCIGCGQCTKVCPFDAIEANFDTRAGDCTFCQTCGGVCPTRAIRFVGRWDSVESPAATIARRRTRRTSRRRSRRRSR